MHSAFLKRVHLSRFMRLQQEHPSASANTFVINTHGLLSMMGPIPLSSQLLKRLESLLIKVSIKNTIIIHIGSQFSFEILPEANAVKVSSKSFCKTVVVDPLTIPSIGRISPIKDVGKFVSGSDEILKPTGECKLSSPMDFSAEGYLMALLLSLYKAIEEGPVLLEMAQDGNSLRILFIVAFFAFISLITFCFYLQLMHNTDIFTYFCEYAMVFIYRALDLGNLPVATTQVLNPVEGIELLPSTNARLVSPVVSAEIIEEGQVGNGVFSEEVPSATLVPHSELNDQPTNIGSIENSDETSNTDLNDIL